MARRTGRLLLVAGASAACAAALFLLAWWSWLPPRFEAAGRTINARARIDPERRYELVVWDETIVVPWGPDSHGAVLAQAVNDFQQRWPNVQVRFSLLDPGQAQQQLSAAIAAGRPPDVYGSVRGLLLYPSHQVPATPYLPPEPRDEPPPFQRAALDGLTRDGAVWGWPRGLWWEVWLADSSLLERAGLDGQRIAQEGWTWDDLMQAAHRLQGAVESILVLDTTAVATLEHLMMNAGPAALAGGPEDAWRETAVADVARVLRELAQSGALPSEPAASRTRLERLFDGRAVVIGPAGPALTQAVVRRQPDRYVLLPVPRLGGSPMVAPMEPGGYFVFRQDTYQGDDHVRLAMELANWLAGRTEAWLVEALGVLPARTDGLHAWHQLAPLSAGSKAFLETYLQHARAPSAGLPAEALAARRVRLEPHWHAFWEGSSSPEDFAASVRRVVETAVEPVPGVP